MRIGLCALLLAAVALTGCRVAEHGRRAASDAFASFVLGSMFRMQTAAPLTQNASAPPVSAAAPSESAAVPVAQPALPAAPLDLTTLPQPESRVAAVDLSPAPSCPLVRVRSIRIPAAKMRVELRMAAAQLRGERPARLVAMEAPDFEALDATVRAAIARAEANAEAERVILSAPATL